MVNKQVIERQGPLMSEIVEGEPIHIGERELIPVARVATYVRRRAFVGDGQLAGQGRGFVRIQPIAIIERDGESERRIPIRDRTAQTLGGLLLAAFIIPLLLAVAVRLARNSRRKSR